MGTEDLLKSSSIPLSSQKWQYYMTISCPFGRIVTPPSQSKLHGYYLLGLTLYQTTELKTIYTSYTLSSSVDWPLRLFFFLASWLSHEDFISTVHYIEIWIQFQQNDSTTVLDDNPRIYLHIEVLLHPDTAILGTEVTLNFSVVDGNATGKAGSYVCYKSQYTSVNEWLCIIHCYIFQPTCSE